MSIEKKVCVFILTHNRPKLVTETLTSIIKQDYPNFDIIISDNSSNDETLKALEVIESNRFKVISRKPMLSSIEHFNIVLTEAMTYDYFMLCHDDDLFVENALSTLVMGFNKDPELAAVSCNAYLQYDELKTDKLFSSSLKEDLLISSAAVFATQYLKPNSTVTPFPSYLYKAKLIKDIFILKKEGLKHADLSFLIKVLNRGPILMLAKPLMFYRKHSANDSNTIDLKATFSIVRFLRNVPGISYRVLDVYVEKSLIKWSVQRLWQKPQKAFSKREKVLFCKALYLLICKGYFRFAFKKLFQ